MAAMTLKMKMILVEVLIDDALVRAGHVAQSDKGGGVSRAAHS